MFGDCSVCKKNTTVIECKSCDKNACCNCLIKFTSDNKFINRNCLCGEKYMVDDLYDAFGQSFMKDTYINTIVNAKIKKFEESFKILERYMATDEKYKIANEELRNLQEKMMKKSSEKIMIKMNVKQMEIKQLYDDNFKILDLFDNTLDNFKSFYEDDANIEIKYSKINTIINKYRKKLKNVDFTADIKSIIDDNLAMINKSFYTIYNIQEACGDFRRYKELDRYRKKTNLIREAIECKVKKNISDEKFVKIVKDNEIISEKIDTVLEYSRHNWNIAENIRKKAFKTFQESKSLDFKEETNIIKNLVKEIENLTNCTNDIVIMKKMKDRYKMTDDELIDYFTIPVQ